MTTHSNLLPKILHIETGMHLYGGAKQVYYLIKGLRAKHFGENILICPDKSHIAKECEKICKTYTPNILGDMDISFFFKLLGIIKKESPNIIHIHSRRGADIWGGLAAKFTNTRVVLTRRVDNPENRTWAKIKYKWFDRVITISKGIYDVLKKQGIEEAKMEIIPSGVDFDFYNKPCNKKWFQREFNIPAKYSTVGMIAQFIPRKGHKFLLDSLPYILKNFPDVVFLLFGQGPLMERIAQLIKTNNLDKNVRIEGFRWDIEKILPCLDIVVHPAFMEGLGVCLLQANSAGVPVVASAVGGIPEIIRDGENGFLFQPGDRDSFVEKTLFLLKNPDLAKKMGQRGKIIIKNYFSIENMVDRYIELYKNLSRPPRGQDKPRR